jgi:CYTH domain-containing protein
VSGVEIERKWLVPDAPPEALAAPSTPILQGYLAIAAGGVETRVRRRGDVNTLTAKSGRGLVRGEHEIELSAAQFDALWPATDGARVEKVRHTLRADDGHLIEVDVFAGTLGGLILAEVEFHDPWAAEAFVVPYWFGREVTADAAYKNQRLAVDGRPAPG